MSVATQGFALGVSVLIAVLVGALPARLWWLPVLVAAMWWMVGPMYRAWLAKQDD